MEDRRLQHLDEVQGVELTWKNLSYKVQTKSKSKLPWKRKTEEKVVLHPFSGRVPPNALVAVMGSSGAGKTTFLNTLACQYNGGVREGDVYLNSTKLTKTFFRKTCGYVQQSDILLPNLTVRETLTFYANILLPLSMPSSEKDERVLSTVRKLGLTHCLDTPIGNDFKRGISGGEKRRVSIAIELLKNPSVIFLDEPTTGLDSKTSLSLITTLSELAHLYNHTIVCTIHQPRSKIFEMFDLLLLFAKGQAVYYGKAHEAINYFAAKGYHCPEYENPSDFFIDLLTVDSDSPELFEESTQRIAHLITLSKEDQQKKGEEEQMTAAINPSPFGTFVLYEVWLLFFRSLVNAWRDRTYLFGRIVQILFLAFFVSILWWQMKKDESAIQDRISVIFMILLGTAMSESMVSALVFPLDRLIYMKEKRAGMYGTVSYYFAKQLAEFPLQLVAPTIFIVVTYFCVGLQYNALHFANFLLLCLLLVFTCNSFGLLMGATFPMQVASVFVPVSLILMLLFAGFYVNTANIPVYLRWAKFVSPFYYAFSGTIYVQFWGESFYCTPGQELTKIATGVCSNGEVLSVTTSACVTTHGQQIINQFNAHQLSLYQCELILFAFVIFLRTLLYFSLLRPPKRF